MIYYLPMHSPNKAKLDIDQFCKEAGYKSLTVGGGKNGLAKFLTKSLTTLAMLARLKRGDVVVLQYPLKKFYGPLCRVAHAKGARTITLVHDLGAFRRQKLTVDQERDRLSLTDFVIVHNARMREHLEQSGLKTPMCDLEIFDYRSAIPVDRQPMPKSLYDIAYAGALGERKNKFFWDFDSLLSRCRLNLYGRGLDPAQILGWNHIDYHGFIDSDEFISTAPGTWGLVWDGDSVDDCSGNWGEYLRINNPHKTSFYLRAGLPVILWSEAAMAPFVKDNNIGITVDSLRELENAISSVTPERYESMRRSVLKVKKQLDQGHYFLTAMDKALSTIDYMEKPQKK